MYQWTKSVRIKNVATQRDKQTIKQSFSSFCVEESIKKYVACADSLVENSMNDKTYIT